MRIDLHVGKTGAQQVAYFREAIERVQARPGIRSAAAIGRFLKSYPPDVVEIEGRPLAPSSQTFEAADDVISGPYFQTAGISLREGRFFSGQDGRDSLPVAIINEAMARSCWPNSGAIGKRFRFPENKSGPWFTVVGVTGDMHREGLEKQVAPQVFRPHSQNPDNEMDLIVRTSSDPLTVAAAVRNQVQSIDKTVPKFGVATVERELGEQTAERRFHSIARCASSSSEKSDSGRRLRLNMIILPWIEVFRDRECRPSLWRTCATGWLG